MFIEVSFKMRSAVCLGMSTLPGFDFLCFDGDASHCESSFHKVMYRLMFNGAKAHLLSA